MGAGIQTARKKRSSRAGEVMAGSRVGRYKKQAMGTCTTLDDGDTKASSRVAQAAGAGNENERSGLR